MEQTIICQGCGATLQTENPDDIGFIPNITNNEALFCQRCFKLRHYNKVETVSLTSDDYLKMVAEIKETNSLIIHLIDVFDVDSTMVDSLVRFVGNNPIILVANKVDLLPKSMNPNRLKKWLRHVAKEAGLSVKDVHIISSKKGHHMDELAKQMEKARKGKDIYVTGVTNVGKSTFMNTFIERSTGHKDAITTSHFPGTTLGFIRIPLDDNSALIDTPGIINEHQLIHYISNQDLKKVLPQKEVKARNYQLHAEQSLFIGGLARMDFVKGDKQTFICYFSNGIPLHRTKLANADDLYERQIGKLLHPPSDASIETLPKWAAQSVKIQQPYTDVVISGLGWITIPKGDVTLTIYKPEGVSVTVRKSLLSKN